MKTVAKLVIMSLVIVPVALLTGCCNKSNDGNHRLEKMRMEKGGK